jgi:hypothetical protein
VSFAGLVLGFIWNGWAEAGGNRLHRHHHHRQHQHRHHHHHGLRIVFYSAPLIVPRVVYPAPVYYAPAPVTYIEQPQAQPDSQAWWYYCREAQAYYPHVQTCPGAWQRVAPQPPSR